MYTQEEIENLIVIPKMIDKAPRRHMLLERGHWRNAMTLISLDNQHHFEVYFRRDDRFPENFSIGLRYKPTDGRGAITLLRLNGPHGFHKSYGHHVGTHIHKAQSELIDEGLKEDGYIEMTKNYGSFEEAVGQLIVTSNIQNSEKHLFLNNTKQLDLSFPKDE